MRQNLTFTREKKNALLEALNLGVKSSRIKKHKQKLHVHLVLRRGHVTLLFLLSSSVVRAVRSQAGGDVVRKLSNDNDDAVAEKRQRGPGV